MKSISIAILVLAIGSTMSETSISVEVAKTTSWLVVKHLNFQVMLTSGAQKAKVDISPLTYWYIFGRFYEFIKEDEYIIYADVFFLNHRERYTLPARRFFIPPMTVSLPGVYQTGEEATPKSDVISTKSETLDHVVCMPEEKLEVVHRYFAFVGTKFVINILLTCNTNTPAEPESEEEKAAKNLLEKKRLADEEEIKRLEEEALKKGGSDMNDETGNPSVIL